MTKKYEVVLFDLDHTLWDYHKNADETLTEIFGKYLASKNGFSISEMITVFKEINDELWADYHNGKISQISIRNSRFERFLEHYSISDSSLTDLLSEEYLSTGPKKSHLIPGTREVLEYLSVKYPMIIVTNGFENTQWEKIRHSNIAHYFDSVITSEKTGIKKPSPEIFYHALSGHSIESAIMIGDNLETDIAGARSAGIDTVHFNPQMDPDHPESTYTISELIELKKIL